MQSRTSGFTLIELLVVIAILSALMVSLLPAVAGPNAMARQLGDRSNYNFHYQQLLRYQKRYRSLPKGEGHRFIFGPWMRGVVPRTEANRDRYFSPGSRYQLEDGCPRSSILAAAVTEIWNTPGELDSQHTDYAGISAAAKPGVRVGRGGGAVLMAFDHEDGVNFYRGGTILVLRANGAVKDLLMDPDFLPHGHKLGDEVVVGPESQVPVLRGLAY